MTNLATDTATSPISLPNFDASRDEIDFADASLTLRRHWRLMAVATAAAGLLALLYVLLARPAFEITGSLYLGDARPVGTPGAPTAGLSFLSDFQAVSDINTQVELIKSKGMIEQAILQSGFNAPVTSVGRAAPRFWRWTLLQGGDVAAYAPRPGDLQAVDAVLDNAPRRPVALTITMGSDGRYGITYKPGWFAAAQPVLTGRLGQPASGGGLHLLLQPRLAGAVPEAGSVFVMKIASAAAVTASLQNAGDFAAVAGGVLNNPTKIANLKLLAADPYEGEIFVNQLMNNFISSQLGWNNQAASATEAFIAKQLTGIRASVADADQKLSAYQAQTGILDVPENAKAIIGQLSQYETQRTQLQLQQEALMQLNGEITHPSGPLNPYLLSQTGDAVLGALATDLADQELKLQALQSQFTGSAPDVQTAQASVARVQESIRSVVGNELASTNDSLAKLNALIAQFEQQLRAMPAQSLRVIALNRASDVYGQIYVLLMQKEEEAEVSKAAAIGDTRVITPAEIPLQSASPKAVVIIIGSLLFGLLASTGFVLGRRALSTRFQSDDEVRRLVKLPIYGMIPQRLREGRRGLLLAGMQTPFAEAMRLLRSNLYRSAAGESARVVLVTSASPNDGKTMIAANLAKALADGGRRVILIDADLHRGRLHEDLRADPTAGLTEWLVTMTVPNFKMSPNERFYVLAAGVLPPNPSELLGEQYFGEIIAALRREFDYVVLDSPPLPAVSDALALGAHADVILSVIRVGCTSKRVFGVHDEMLSTLERRHGIIINGIAGDRYGYGYAAARKPGLSRRMIDALAGRNS